MLNLNMSEITIQSAKTNCRHFKAKTGKRIKQDFGL